MEIKSGKEEGVKTLMSLALDKMMQSKPYLKKLKKRIGLTDIFGHQQCQDIHKYEI